MRKKPVSWKVTHSKKLLAYSIIYKDPSLIFAYQCSILGQFAMPETCENWLHPVNSCIYYATQTQYIYQVQPNSVDFKAPGE